jgi:uncharacterized protein YkvS
MFNSYEFFYDGTRKGWPFNTGDIYAQCLFPQRITQVLKKCTHSSIWIDLCSMSTFKQEQREKTVVFFYIKWHM